MDAGIIWDGKWVGVVPLYRHSSSHAAAAIPRRTDVCYRQRWQQGRPATLAVHLLCSFSSTISPPSSGSLSFCSDPHTPIPTHPIPLFHPFPFPITASAHLSKVRPRCLCLVDTLNGYQRLVGPRVPLSALVSEDPAFRVETGRQLARRRHTGSCELTVSTPL